MNKVKARKTAARGPVSRPTIDEWKEEGKKKCGIRPIHDREPIKFFRQKNYQKNQSNFTRDFALFFPQKKKTILMNGWLAMPNSILPLVEQNNSRTFEMIFQQIFQQIRPVLIQILWCHQLANIFFLTLVIQSTEVWHTLSSPHILLTAFQFPRFTLLADLLSISTTRSYYYYFYLLVSIN